MTRDIGLGLKNYIDDHSEVEFSHSICRECMEERYPDIDDDG